MFSPECRGPPRADSIPGSDAARPLPLVGRQTPEPPIQMIPSTTIDVGSGCRRYPRGAPEGGRSSCRPDGLEVALPHETGVSHASNRSASRRGPWRSWDVLHDNCFHGLLGSMKIAQVPIRHREESIAGDGHQAGVRILVTLHCPLRAFGPRRRSLSRPERGRYTPDGGRRSRLVRSRRLMRSSHALELPCNEGNLGHPPYMDLMPDDPIALAAPSRSRDPFPRDRFMATSTGTAQLRAALVAVGAGTHR